MNETNKKIDQYLRRQRFRNVAKWTSILGVIAFVVAALTMPLLGDQSQVEGIVASLTARQHEEGHTLKLVVTLDNSEQVLVVIPRSKYDEKGNKVRLLKREPLMFGKTIYSFRGYARDGEA
ncbi:hypothetical protein A3758_17250 [Oleiphilus sp. HI0118]|nr:hypothetical protein A3758_04100 [Oleiphilus sp. HI0118]KZZ48511.1 hypothetical protein A3758_17250 [Oleiphilus sp. HI0118]